MASDCTITKLAEMKNEIVQNSKARERLSNLFDEGNFTEMDLFTKQGDNLAGVITAYGYINSNPVYAFSQDVSVDGGALGTAAAKKIAKIYDLAAKTGVPVVGVYDSNGIVLTDGIGALTSCSELLMKTANLSGVVPQISVIAGTCAGMQAMLATSADFVVMAKDAELFIAPNSKIKEGAFAENSAKCGTINLICDDDMQAMEKAKELIARLPGNNLSGVPMFEFTPSGLELKDDADSMVKAIADAGSVIELSSDFGLAAYTAIASVGGATVGFVATNKTQDKLTADDCSKISRFIRTCDAFSLPVVTLVDTQGFDLSDDAQTGGSLRDMTKIAFAYAEATTAKISIIVGKAYGSAYMALAGKGAGADLTYAYPNAVISAIDPLTAVEFFKHDELKGAADVDAKRKELAETYCANEASAFVAAQANCIEDIINPLDTRVTIATALEILASKRTSRLPKKHSNMPF